MYDKDMFTNDEGHTGSKLNKEIGRRVVTGERQTTDRDGTLYKYNLYHCRKFSTVFGGSLTGMLSVGIGEVVMPQLVKDGKVPVPGVIIGGQIGSRLQGKVHSHTMEKIIGGLFAVIGVAMLWTVYKDLMI